MTQKSISLEEKMTILYEALKLTVVVEANDADNACSVFSCANSTLQYYSYLPVHRSPITCEETANVLSTDVSETLT